MKIEVTIDPKWNKGAWVVGHLEISEEDLPEDPDLKELFIEDEVVNFVLDSIRYDWVEIED